MTCMSPEHGPHLVQMTCCSDFAYKLTAGLLFRHDSVLYRPRPHLV